MSIYVNMGICVPLTFWISDLDDVLCQNHYCEIMSGSENGNLDQPQSQLRGPDPDPEQEMCISHLSQGCIFYLRRSSSLQRSFHPLCFVMFVLELLVFHIKERLSRPHEPAASSTPMMHDTPKASTGCHASSPPPQDALQKGQDDASTRANASTIVCCMCLTRMASEAVE